MKLDKELSTLAAVLRAAANQVDWFAEHHKVALSSGPDTALSRVCRADAAADAVRLSAEQIRQIVSAHEQLAAAAIDVIADNAEHRS